MASSNSTLGAFHRGRCTRLGLSDWQCSEHRIVPAPRSNQGIVVFNLMKDGYL